MTYSAITSVAVVAVFFLMSPGCSVVGPELPDVSAVAPEPGEVEAKLRTVTMQEMEHLGPLSTQPPDWLFCTLYSGIMAAYKATEDTYFLDLVESWGKAHEWTLLPERPWHADDHCAGQVFVEAYLNDLDPNKLRSTRETLRRVVSDPRPGYEVWYWADALFMAPPVLARLGTATGEDVYFDVSAERFWEVSNHLFDAEHGLYYRDERFFDNRSRNGKAIFWSRGNGWVLAGIARILRHLPLDHPDHAAFVAHFRHMAGTVGPLQGSDGFWRSSLLDPDAFPAPESSGTALFAYALAWGINAGHLSFEEYGPVVFRAWAGLNNALTGDGRLGLVQAVGAEPGTVSKNDTGVYGTGGLLLAGSELLYLLEHHPDATAASW